MQPDHQNAPYSTALVVVLLGLGLYMSAVGVREGPAFFEDNLPGRPQLIALSVRLRMKLGDRLFHDVLVGKDGWLHYATDLSLDDFQHVTALPPDDIAEVKQRVEELEQRLRKRNIKLLVVIVPDKASVYPETMPDEIPRLAEQSDLDKLVAVFAASDSSLLLDLRPALLAARSNQVVYYKTDSHWNPRGEYAAYTALMDSLAAGDPNLAPWKLGAFRFSREPARTMDLADLMGATNILEIREELGQKKAQWAAIQYNQDRLPALVTSGGPPGSPSLLMYYDSFGARLIHYMAPHFARATFLPNTIPPAGLTAQVETTQPDILIIEFVERNLVQLLNFLRVYAE